MLHILENGDTVHSMADLAGKTIYSINQGTNTEYVLNYLLEESGLTPGDVQLAVVQLGQDVYKRQSWTAPPPAWPGGWG